jgi:hypothetical protein
MMKNFSWKIAAASAKGKGHKECQDSFAYEILDNLIICVITDGAGSQKNSKLGSLLISKFAIKLFKQYALKYHLANHTNTLSSNTWRTDSIAILNQIRKKLNKIALSKKYDLCSMASTLIVAISTPTVIYSIHIGDGRAGYLNMEQEWKSFITPYTGIEVGMTVFLTTEYIWQYPQDYIETNVVHDKIKAITLLSDGAENASYKCINFDKETQKYIDYNKPHPGFYNPLVKFILENINVLDDDLHKVWGQFLADGTPAFTTETDDKTILLATNYAV